MTSFIRLSRSLCRLRSFTREERAASVAEYALLLGVLTVALILVLGQFRNAVGNSFSRSSSAMASAEQEAASGGNGGTGGTGETGGSGGTGGTPAGNPGGGNGNGNNGNGNNGNGNNGNGNNGNGNNGNGNNGNNGNNGGGNPGKGNGN